MLRIGEFAALTGLGVKALRHYDAVDLLPPAHVDPRTGYRSYHATQVATAARIAALRQLGVGLDQIRAVLDGADGADSLAVHRRALARQRDELDRAIAALDAFVPTAPVCTKRVPGGHYATERATVTAPGDVGALFVAVEGRVASCGRRAPAPPLARVHGRTGPGLDVEVAVPVADGDADAALPTRRVASAVVVGSYTGVAGATDAVMAWLRATGHEPRGPVEESYVRFAAEPALGLPSDLLATDEAAFVTEVRVPF